MIGCSNALSQAHARALEVSGEMWNMQMGLRWAMVSGLIHRAALRIHIICTYVHEILACLGRMSESIYNTKTLISPSSPARAQ